MDSRVQRNSFDGSDPKTEKIVYWFSFIKNNFRFFEPFQEIPSEFVRFRVLRSSGTGSAGTEAVGAVWIIRLLVTTGTEAQRQLDHWMVDLMRASFVGRLARTRAADASFLFAIRAAQG